MKLLTALFQLNPTWQKTVAGIFGFGIVTFLMLLIGNIMIKRRVTGIGKVAANKAVFNTTLVLAIMIGLWVLFTMTDRLFAEGSAEAMTRIPF